MFRLAIACCLFFTISWASTDEQKDCTSLDFIQIGAHIFRPQSDFVYKSVMEGARGILIEPVPHLLDNIKQMYKDQSDNLIFLQKAISDHNGILTLFTPSQENDFSKFPLWCTAISSSNPDHITLHRKDLLIDEIKVECVAINDLIKEYNVQQLKGLYIDTEGHDYCILKSLDFKLLRPEKIVFENKHMDGVFNRGKRYNELITYLRKQGYEVINKTKEDTIVVDIRSKN